MPKASSYRNFHKRVHTHVRDHVHKKMWKHVLKHAHKISHHVNKTHHGLLHVWELILVWSIWFMSLMFAWSSNLPNNTSFDYPLQKVSTLECRTLYRNDMPDSCKITLPKIHGADYDTYKDNELYRSIYTVLRAAPYSDSWNQKLWAHAGIDVATARGTPLYSIWDGEVYSAWRNSAYGNVVKIKYVYQWEIVYAIYAHMDSIDIEKWDKVTKWQRIWDTWNSGNTFGALWWYHVHFEIDKDNYGRPAYSYTNCPDLSKWHYKIIQNGLCRTELFSYQYDPIRLFEANSTYTHWWADDVDDWSNTDTSNDNDNDAIDDNSDNIDDTENNNDGNDNADDSNPDDAEDTIDTVDKWKDIIDDKEDLDNDTEDGTSDDNTVDNIQDKWNDIIEDNNDATEVIDDIADIDENSDDNTDSSDITNNEDNAWLEDTGDTNNITDTDGVVDTSNEWTNNDNSVSTDNTNNEDNTWLENTDTDIGVDIDDNEYLLDLDFDWVSTLAEHFVSQWDVEMRSELKDRNLLLWETVTLDIEIFKKWDKLNNEKQWDTRKNTINRFNWILNLPFVLITTNNNIDININYLKLITKWEATVEITAKKSWTSHIIIEFGDKKIWVLDITVN